MYYRHTTRVIISDESNPDLSWNGSLCDEMGICFSSSFQLCRTVCPHELNESIKPTLLTDASSDCEYPSRPLTLKKIKWNWSSGVFLHHLAKTVPELFWCCGTGCARLDDGAILPSSRIHTVHHSSSHWQELFVATRPREQLPGLFTERRDWFILILPAPQSPSVL